MSFAIFSPCRRWRYSLERPGAGDGQTAVIMVNPSTADADTDDATIRRVRGFGERYGWRYLIVGNLFAFRATDIRELETARDAIGPENDIHLRAMIRDADRLVVAWGPMAKLPKRLRTRFRTVLEMAAEEGRQPMSIGRTAKDGHPRHPLMLPYADVLQPWAPPL